MLSPLPADVEAYASSSPSQRRERARAAAGYLCAGAGAMPHELPGVTLEVDGRSALTRRSGPSCAVVLTFQRDAEALLLSGRYGGLPFCLGQRAGNCH